MLKTNISERVTYSAEEHISSVVSSYQQKASKRDTKPLQKTFNIVAASAVESVSRSRIRKDFQPKESESQKISTTPTPDRPFAHQVWLFVPQTCVSVTLGNLSRLTLQQEMIMAIQTGAQLAYLHSGAIPDQQRPWVHHATYTLWMQPFGACITEISICSFWLDLSLLRDVGYATMNESSHGSSSIVT